MSFFNDVELFPITAEDEERQLRLAIIESLQPTHTQQQEADEIITLEEKDEKDKPPDVAKEPTAGSSKPRSFKRANTTAVSRCCCRENNMFDIALMSRQLEIKT